MSQGVFLTGDGLGSIRFGDHYDTVLGAMEAEIGPPTSEGDALPLDYDCGAPGGACEPEWLTECTSQGPNRVEATVQWEGLQLTFRGPDAESMVLKNWSVSSGIEPTTPEGLAIADAPDAWKGTYGDRITFEYMQGGEGEAIYGVSLELRGEITGFATLGETEWMNSLAAGFFCWANDF